MGNVANYNPAGIRWLRQKGETRKAYAAFRCYRDMGEGRSIWNVCKELDKSYHTISRWCQRWDWVDRASAFDAEEDFKLIVMMRQQRKDMRVNDAKIARAVKDTVMEAMKNIKPEDLTPAQCMKWLEVGVKVERLALGESTENIAEANSFNPLAAAEEQSQLEQAIDRNPELASQAAKLLESLRDSPE